jgi:hypothetical protein
VGVDEPPEGPAGPAPETPDEPRPGLSTPAKIGAGAFVGALYAIGMSLRGDVLPGVVGGVLAGVLCFLVLREIEMRRDRRG